VRVRGYTEMFRWVHSSLYSVDAVQYPVLLTKFHNFDVWSKIFKGLFMKKQLQMYIFEISLL
jgi:hypothetical protein